MTDPTTDAITGSWWPTIILAVISGLLLAGVVKMTLRVIPCGDKRQ